MGWGLRCPPSGGVSLGLTGFKKIRNGQPLPTNDYPEWSGFGSGLHIGGMCWNGPLLDPHPEVVAAAIVSLLTILTIRETAGRSLPQGVADEMFQSDADVRGAATLG